MRPTTNALLLLALSAMIGACGSATNTPERRPLLAELPLDSLIKTLGPDIAGHKRSRGGGTSNDMTGRFEVNYIADFDAPVVDGNMISYLAAKVQEIILHRGGRVRGGSSMGAFTTFDYSADSLYGLVAIAAIKNDQSNHANYESLVISVREVAVPVR
jgi:hypothetical protein